MSTEQIIITGIFSIVPALMAFLGIWMKLNHSDKNRNVIVDARLDKIENFMFNIAEKDKHKDFSKRMDTSLRVTNYNYVLGFEKLDKRVSEFLLQGIENSITIFTNIVSTEFKHYDKSIIEAQFKVARVGLKSKFLRGDFPIDKKIIKNRIEKHRDSFLNSFDVLMKSSKENGDRMDEFSLICDKMLNGIIADITSIQGAKIEQTQ